MQNIKDNIINKIKINLDMMEKQITASFIGSGRVATQLAKALIPYIDIKQIYSRHLEHAQRLATLVHATAIGQIEHLENVDIIFIAVNDIAIHDIAQRLSEIHYTGLVVHTSGSTNIRILSDFGLNAGVFYPLQTFSFEKDINWQDVPIFVEAIEPRSLTLLNQVAYPLSNKVMQYNSEQRLSLHLAAVFACNFSNYCYDIAEQILENQGVDKYLLFPLIKETAHKFEISSAYSNQTGPAQRQDDTILSMHQLMLEYQPEWKEIYAIFSQAIQNRHQQ